MTDKALSPKEIAALLRITIPARMPVMIAGRPGVGKTSIPTQVAGALGYDVVTSHPGLDDPTAGSGMPWPNSVSGEMDMLPRAELARVLKAVSPTLWVWDDFTQAVPAVQNAYRPWLTARRIGAMVLPDCVSIVATGNRVKDRSDAKAANANVKSGFHSIVEMEASVDDWTEWALGAGILPWIIAFIRFRPEMLCAADVALGMANEHNPRTVHHASDLLAAGMPAGIRHNVIAGAAGEAWATEALAFEGLISACVSADQILADPSGAPLPGGPAQEYATASVLAYRADVGTFDRIAVYLERMAASSSGEAFAYCVKDCIQRCPAVTATAGYLKLVSGTYGKLLAGDYGSLSEVTL